MLLTRGEWIDEPRDRTQRGNWTIVDLAELFAEPAARPSDRHAIPSALRHEHVQGAREMVQIEIKKTCRSCGMDLTDKRRHKNSQGEYYCSECLEGKKRPPRACFLGITGKKLRRVLLCVFLAALASWLLWEFLDVFSHARPPNP